MNISGASSAKRRGEYRNKNGGCAFVMGVLLSVWRRVPSRFIGGPKFMLATPWAWLWDWCTKQPHIASVIQGIKFTKVGCTS